MQATYTNTHSGATSPSICTRAYIARHARARRGFTMLEIVTVLVITGLMLTLAITHIDTSKYRADAVAEIVRTTLQDAQRQAITKQYDMVVSFDTTGERLRVLWDANDDGQISPGERTLFHGLDVGVLFTDPTVNGVSGNPITKPVNGAGIATLTGYPTITFHRDGSVSTDAEIYVSIAARGRPNKIYRAITLVQSTGRVDWFRLNTGNNKWVQANQ